MDNFLLCFVGMVGMIGMAGITPRFTKNDKTKLPRRLLHGTSYSVYYWWCLCSDWFHFRYTFSMIYFRKIVPLGRSCGVTIPKEIVRDLGWSPCDDVAIFVTKDNEVLIRRMAPCEVSNFVAEFEPTIFRK